MAISRLVGAICLSSTLLPHFSGGTGSTGSLTPVPAGKVTLIQAPFPQLPAPADGRIDGDGFSGLVTGYQCASSIPDDAGTLTPPAGDDVCVFSLSVNESDTGTFTIDGQFIEPPAGTVSFGSTKLALSEQDFFDTESYEYAFATPRGERPTLELSAGGFSQSFSFATGSRVGTSPELLYRPTSEHLSIAVGDKTTLPETDRSTGMTAGVEVTVSTALLTYFSPDNPAVTPPSPDEAFLTLQFTTNQVRGPDGGTFQVIDALPGSAVRLELPGGKIIDSTAEINGSPVLGVLGDNYTFVVPADITTAQLLLGPGNEPATELAPSGNTGGDNVQVGTATIPSSSGGGVPVVPVAAGAAGGLVVVAFPIFFWRRRKEKELFVFFPVPAGSPPDPDGKRSTSPVTKNLIETPPADDTADEAPQEGEQAPPKPLRVRILGPIGVDGYAEEPANRDLVDELVVYLALRGGRKVSSDKLRMVLGDITRGTLMNRVSDLRKAVGPERMPHSGKSGYSFNGVIDLDWANFNELRQQAAGATGAERISLLESALALVKGVPFSEMPTGRYKWFDQEFVITEFTKPIEKVAHELAEALIAVGRNRDAEDAARRGLRGSPGSEDLWCDVLDANAGDAVRLKRIYPEAVADAGETERLVSLYERLMGEAGA